MIIAKSSVFKNVYPWSTLKQKADVFKFEFLPFEERFGNAYFRDGLV